MLDQLGETETAERIRAAVAGAMADRLWTPDLGGSSTTGEVAQGVIERLS
jgi:isocitrate/isopropylmalate dehydrogenase